MFIHEADGRLRIILRRFFAGKGKKENLYQCRRITEIMGGIYIILVILDIIGIPY